MALCWTNLVKFDCSVNKLQPADIEIVAALGDSVIGSTGCLPLWCQHWTLFWSRTTLGGDAPNLFHTRNQYRGVSFAIGSLGTWRTVTTLPNILKVFNPHIAGGSVNIGGEFDRGTNLNLARYLTRNLTVTWLSYGISFQPRCHQQRTHPASCEAYKVGEPLRRLRQVEAGDDTDWS